MESRIDGEPVRDKRREKKKRRQRKQQTVLVRNRANGTFFLRSDDLNEHSHGAERIKFYNRGTVSQ